MIANIIKATIAIIFIFVLLEGCAVHPGGPVLDNGLLPKLEPGFARVVVFRDDGTFINSLFFKANVLLDDEIMLSLPHKSFGYFDAPVGSHKLDLQWQLDFKRGGPRIVLEDGETIYFQVTSSMGWFGLSTSLVGHDNEKMTLNTIKSCCRLIDTM